MKVRSWIVSVGICGALGSGPAHAAAYVEQGDAPELAGGQVISAGEAVTAIEGILGGGVNADVDMYTIRVDDWSLFAASTRDVSGLTSPETQTYLSLFDADGHGIAFRGGIFAGQVELPAGEPVYAGRSNGEIVWLAISAAYMYAQSGGQEIWDPYAAGVRAPDGPGGAGALDGWAGTDIGGTYRITLSGVSAVPAPSGAALLGLVSVLAARRWRRSRP